MRGACFCARKTWGRRGHVGTPPPRSPCVPILPKVTIGGWRWGTWWEMSQGTREKMTGAHLGDCAACRQRSCSATAAPREGARRRGHGDGRHHPRPQRSLFSPNSDRRVTLFSVTNIMLMDQPHRFSGGPTGGIARPPPAPPPNLTTGPPWPASKSCSLRNQRPGLSGRPPVRTWQQ